MKKFKLDLKQNDAEILSREQLKQIRGGVGGDEGGGDGGEPGGTPCFNDSHCGYKSIPCYPWATAGHCIGLLIGPTDILAGKCRWAGCPS
jgi:hypothetical protein